MDRTILANERTYAAWLRTGLAALVTGPLIFKNTGHYTRCAMGKFVRKSLP